MMILQLLLGFLGAISLIAIARIQPDYERRVLAVGLAIAPLIYVGFAFLGEANQSWLITELVGVGIYGFFAVMGLWFSTGWLILGWLAHPVWDVGLHFAGAGTAYTPVWYAIVCLSLDLTIAAYLGGRQTELIKLNSSKPDAA